MENIEKKFDYNYDLNLMSYEVENIIKKIKKIMLLLNLKIELIINNNFNRNIDRWYINILNYGIK